MIECSYLMARERFETLKVTFDIEFSLLKVILLQYAYIGSIGINSNLVHYNYKIFREINLIFKSCKKVDFTNLISVRANFLFFHTVHTVFDI